MAKSFIEQFQDWIEEEGYTSITDFVNDWIKEGGTFRTLHEWTALRGATVVYLTLWTALRKYITVPYSGEDQFWYKWESVAKAKGYSSVETMVKSLRKYTTAEIARELDIAPTYAKELMRRLSYSRKRKVPEKRKMKKAKPFKTKEGFSREETRKKWEALLKEKKFRSLRHALRILRNKGLSFERIAKELGVAYTTLRMRMDRAKISGDDYPRGKYIYKSWPKEKYEEE